MPIYAILKFAANLLQIIQICKDFSQKNIVYAGIDSILGENSCCLHDSANVNSEGTHPKFI